jgi:hypothetical protein
MGAPDLTFGKGGRVDVERTADNEAAVPVLLPDGRISLVLRVIDQATNGVGRVVTRYLSDGTPDPSFPPLRAGGIVDGGAQVQTAAAALLSPSACEFVVAGERGTGANDHAWVERIRQ